MAQAGYLATVFVTGTSTGLTGAGEPTTLVGGTTYVITDTAKRIVDPATALIVEDGTGAIATSGYTFDYLTGTVVLAVAPTGSVVIKGNYLPRRQITNAYECSATLARTLVDTSLLGTEHTQRTTALGDVSGSMSCYDTGLEVYTDVDLAQILVDGTTKVIEMAWNTNQHLRFFAKIESAEASAAVDGVQTVSFSFQMDGQTALTTGQEVDISIAP